MRPPLTCAFSKCAVSLCMSSGTGSIVSSVVPVLLFHHHLCQGCPSTPGLSSAGAGADHHVRGRSGTLSRRSCTMLSVPKDRSLPEAARGRFSACASVWQPMRTPLRARICHRGLSVDARPSRLITGSLPSKLLSPCTSGGQGGGIRWRKFRVWGLGRR
jgi:hypothetical protein